MYHHWRILGWACPAHPPKGPDSFVLTYKIFLGKVTVLDIPPIMGLVPPLVLYPGSTTVALHLLMPNVLSTCCSGGSRGNSPGTCPAKGPNSFVLPQKKFTKHRHFGNWCPPLHGKSWICHCVGTFIHAVHHYLVPAMCGM